jgi:hypothetical protein
MPRLSIAFVFLLFCFCASAQKAQPISVQEPTVSDQFEPKALLHPRQLAQNAQWNPRMVLIQEQPPKPGERSASREEERQLTEDKYRQLRENDSLWREDTDSNERPDDEGENRSSGFSSESMGGTPIVGNIIDGYGPTSLRPPDNAMAINGNGDIVSLINGRIEIFDEDGTEQLSSSVADFFSAAGPSATVFDPRVEYSQNNNKYVIVVMHGSTPSTTKLYLAFSTTSDPMDPWWFYVFDADLCADDVSWFDFPSVGMSSSELFVSGNLFTPVVNDAGETNNSFDQTILWQIEMMSGFVGANVSATIFCDVNNSGGGSTFTMVPMSHGFSSYGPQMWFASTNDGANIHWWRISGDLDSSPTLSSFVGDIPNYSGAGSCPQLDENNPLSGGGNRLRDGFFHGSNIYCTHALNNGNGWYGIRAYRINTNTGDVTHSDILGLDGYDYSYPSIEAWGANSATWDGECILGFMRTASVQYPQMRAAVLGSNMVFNSSFLLKGGTSAIGFNGVNEDGTPATQRWGDYTDAHWREGTGHSEVWFFAHVGESNSYKNYIVQVSDEFNGCTDPGACNYDPLATTDDGSCETASCTGCMNENACNYNPNATIAGLCLLPGCTDASACNYSLFAGCSDGSCCYNTCLKLNMEDSFGDGWNGATYSISNLSTGTLASGTMENGFSETVTLPCAEAGCYEIEVTNGIFPGEISWSIEADESGFVFYFPGFEPTVDTVATGGAGSSVIFTVGGGGEDGGCTDNAACNYDDTALCDDGSCCYENCISILMTDDFGDGWNNNIWVVSDLESGEIVETGTLSEGAVGEGLACLPDGCYGFSIDADAGLFAYEIGWTIMVGDVEVGAGGYLDETSFLVGTGVETAGCTDANACNYDYTALCDDGSCCFSNCGSLLLLDSYGDGWNGGSLNLSSTDGSMAPMIWTLVGGDEDEVTLCLEDGCYLLSTSEGQWPEEVSWLFNVSGSITGGGMDYDETLIGINSLLGCTDAMACNYDELAVCDDGTCRTAGCMDAAACNFDPDVDCGDAALCNYACWGCTYAEADNYNSSSTYDDGSCEFSSGEEPDCLGDLNGDLAVTVADLLVLLGVFSSMCE